VVKVHQKVRVTVLEVDLARRRIALSMKSAPEPGVARTPRTGPAEGGRRPFQTPAGVPAKNWFTDALNKARR
jgi:uncharacterized protein